MPINLQEKDSITQRVTELLAIFMVTYLSEVYLFILTTNCEIVNSVAIYR